MSDGYIPILLHQMPQFQQHSFFAGSWPVKQMGLTKMDYSKIHLSEADAILKTCAITPIHEAMDETHIRNVARGIRKVARYYAA